MYSHVKCTKYETCAILHGFHILYVSRYCNSKVETPHVFEVILFKSFIQLILEIIANKDLDFYFTVVKKDNFTHITSEDKKNEHKSVNIFLPVILSMCFGCSKEPSHCDGSFEYP